MQPSSHDDRVVGGMLFGSKVIKINKLFKPNVDNDVAQNVQF